MRSKDPAVFSFSPDRASGSFGASHGGLKTKAEVPVQSILVTDQFNNVNHKFAGEDETVFSCPVAEMEITAKP